MFTTVSAAVLTGVRNHEGIVGTQAARAVAHTPTSLWSGEVSKGIALFGDTGTGTVLGYIPHFVCTDLFV